MRGLDIGTGVWNATTEFMFNEKYMQLEKERDVRLDEADVRRRDQGEEEGRAVVRADGPGYFWIDDVSWIKVGDECP